MRGEYELWNTSPVHFSNVIWFDKKIIEDFYAYLLKSDNLHTQSQRIPSMILPITYIFHCIRRRRRNCSNIQLVDRMSNVRPLSPSLPLSFFFFSISLLPFSCTLYILFFSSLNLHVLQAMNTYLGVVECSFLCKIFNFSAIMTSYRPR